MLLTRFEPRIAGLDSDYSAHLSTTVPAPISAKCLQ